MGPFPRAVDFSTPSLLDQTRGHGHKPPGGNRHGQQKTIQSSFMLQPGIIQLESPGLEVADQAFDPTAFATPAEGVSIGRSIGKPVARTLIFFIPEGHQIERAERGLLGQLDPFQVDRFARLHLQGVQALPALFIGTENEGISLVPQAEVPSLSPGIGE